MPTLQIEIALKSVKAHTLDVYAIETDAFERLLPKFMNSEATQKILLLAANPIGSQYLRLGEEMREIEEGLKRSMNRERYSLATAQAVRYSEAKSY